MKTLDKSLNMLALADDFIIEKFEEEQNTVSYKISDKKINLAAFYENGKFTYCISGVYNSGIDYAEINIERLNALMKFCAYLQEFSQ